MNTLDTCVVVRLLLQDDAQQVQAAVDWLTDNHATVDLIALVETAWVVCRAPGGPNMPRAEFLARMAKLFATQAVEPGKHVKKAIRLMFAGVDPGDAGILASATGDVVTFDKALAKNSGVVLLS